MPRKRKGLIDLLPDPRKHLKLFAQIIADQVVFGVPSQTERQKRRSEATHNSAHNLPSESAKPPRTEAQQLIEDMTNWQRTKWTQSSRKLNRDMKTLQHFANLPHWKAAAN